MNRKVDQFSFSVTSVNRLGTLNLLNINNPQAQQKAVR